MFIPPMLCSSLRDLSRLGDPRYASEPKLDGQRAQVHVAEGRTVAAFSRPGYSLLAYPGLTWLRTVAWPFAQGILDGELCAATGMEGILGVFEARKQAGAPVAFLAFDLLEIDGREVMSEPWTDRRKRLEDLGAELPAPVGLVTVADDAARVWATWVGWGGEGIVLKDRRAPYTPGVRTPHWLKVKQRLTLRVRVIAGEPDVIKWGEWGWAARVRLAYTHPRTGARTTIDELVRVMDPEAWALRRGPADVLCWGVLPSGRLRHPMFVNRQ
jgi:bifunctional non-homologous end joining protein LigD